MLRRTQVRRQNERRCHLRQAAAQGVWAIWQGLGESTIEYQAYVDGRTSNRNRHGNARQALARPYDHGATGTTQKCQGSADGARSNAEVGDRDPQHSIRVRPLAAQKTMQLLAFQDRT